MNNAEDYRKCESVYDLDIEDLERLLKNIPNGLETVEKYQKEHKEFNIDEFLNNLDSEVKKELLNIVLENEIDWYSAEFDIGLDLYIEQLEEEEKYN